MIEGIVIFIGFVCVWRGLAWLVGQWADAEQRHIAADRQARIRQLNPEARVAPKAAGWPSKRVG